MKFNRQPNLLRDSEVRLFRFAIVLAAVAVVSLLTRSVNSQEVNPDVNSEIRQTMEPKEARNIIHWTTSYQEAIDTADENNLPIMLYFGGSDWCPWTKKLSKEVFETREFSAWTESRVIPVLLDYPRTKKLPASLVKQNNLLLNRFRPHLTGFPTALFVKADGTVIGKLGYEPGGHRVWIHKAQKIVGKLDKVAQFFKMFLSANRLNS